MSFTAALILFLSVVFLYLVFIEIFAIVFMVTGLNESKAKFQVISLITNTGFTTRDSELIMENTLRKKIARFIMIFSYCFNISVMALLVNFFSKIAYISNANFILVLSVFALFCFVYVLIKKVSFSKKLFYRFIEKLTRKVFYKDDTNTVLVIEKLSHDVVLAKVIISYVPNNVKDKIIKESQLKNRYNLQLIAITRKGESIFPISANDIICKDDAVLVVGKLDNINEFAKDI